MELVKVRVLVFVCILFHKCGFERLANIGHISAKSRVTRRHKIDSNIDI